MQTSAQPQDRQMLVNVINKSLSTVIESTGKVDLNVRSVNEFFDETKGENRIIVNFFAVTKYKESQIKQALLNKDLQGASDICFNHSFPASFVREGFYLPTKGEKISAIIGTYTNNDGIEVLRVEKMLPIGKAEVKKSKLSIEDLLNGIATEETTEQSEADAIADAVTKGAF